MLNHLTSSALMIGSYPGKQVQRYWKCVLTKSHIIVEKYVDKLREESWDCAEKKTVIWKKKFSLSHDEVSQNTHNMLHFLCDTFL